MADFQKSVNLDLAAGVHGAFASVNPVVSTGLGYIAAEPIPIGGFCWMGSEEGTVVAHGTTRPLGFVARNVIYSDCPKNGEIEYVPVGDTVNVQVQGDFYVKLGAGIAKGSKVAVDPTTGKVIGGVTAGGGTSTVIETSFYAEQDGKSGDTIVISCHGNTPVGVQ